MDGRQADREGPYTILALFSSSSSVIQDIFTSPGLMHKLNLSRTARAVDCVTLYIPCLRRTKNDIEIKKHINKEINKEIN